jgi:hypothetical protein
MGPWTAGKIFLSTAISKELEKQKKKQPPPGRKNPWEFLLLRPAFQTKLMNQIHYI